MSNSKPWQQQKIRTIEEVHHILKINLPSLDINTLTALGDGWDNTTYLVNKIWAFRLPKHAEAAQLLRNEIKILSHLPRLSAEVPKPHDDGVRR